MVLVLSLGIFFHIGCGGVGVRTQPLGAGGYQSYPSTAWLDPGMPMDSASLDITPFIIGAVVIVAAAVAYMYIEAKRDRIRYALTPEGEKVKLLAHAEAPEGAVFLGDIHTGTHLHIDYVKNDLRNQTARLGGDLMVLDDIQQNIHDGQTWGYVGIGRAYKTRGKSN